MPRRVHLHRAIAHAYYPKSPDVDLSEPAGAGSHHSNHHDQHSESRKDPIREDDAEHRSGDGDLGRDQPATPQQFGQDDRRGNHTPSPAVAHQRNPAAGGTLDVSMRIPTIELATRVTNRRRSLWRAQPRNRAVVRKPVWATMRWSGRTAWPSTYHPRCSTSRLLVPFHDLDASVARSCETWMIDGV